MNYKAFSLKHLFIGVMAITTFSSLNVKAEEVNKSKILKIEDAIAKAFVSSPQISILKAELKNFEGKRKQAGLWQNPEFAFEAENFGGAGELSGNNGAEYTYSLSQTIEVGGKISSRVKAADNLKNAATQNFEALKADLTANVIKRYVEVENANKKLELAKDIKHLAGKVYKTVKKRVDAAKEPELQLSKAAVEKSTAKISYQNALREVDISKSNLASFWGKSDLDYIISDDYLNDVKKPKEFEYYKAKLSASPFIKQYDFIEAEKNSLLDLENAMAIPDPTIFGGVRDFDRTGDQAFLVGVSLPIPVWNRNQGNIISANSEVSKAKNQKIKTSLDLNRELVSEHQSWELAYQEVNSLRGEIIPSAEKAFKDASKAYESGRFPYIEVLDAQRTLFDAKEKLIDALKRYHFSKAEVLRLTNSFPYQVTFNGE
jgi:cobalt-zinc-cadmium efflux system outer membrane protein